MVEITKIDTFIRGSPNPTWLATRQGRCVYANPALQRLTGLNLDQISQADWSDFLLEEDRTAATASWQRSLASGTSYRMHVRMQGSDGVPETVELIAFGHKVRDGTELWLFTGLNVNGATQQVPLLEAQLQATLNVIPAYTWYALPSGALTFVNERNANYLGLPKDHPLRFGIDTGAAWDSHIPLLHPDDREETRRVWSTCLRTGCAGEVTVRVRNAEGGYRWFLSRVEPLHANDGTLRFWIGVSLDIDDAKRAGDAVRKSEKELRDAIDTIPALVWSALPDGSNTYVNKRFVEYTGSSAEQTAGSGWQALVHPDDLERHAGKWMEAVATGKPHESEVRSRRSDGQYRWQLDRGVPLRDEDGNIVKWYGVTTDIEDRKRAEEALGVLSRDLQESKAKLEEAQRITHVGYWEWDILTGRVNWSDETYRIYGLRPQERPMDLATVQEKVHPEDWQRGMEEALGGARFNVECRLFRPTGEVRIAHFQGDVNRDASGRPYRIFGTIQDITDRKRAEQRLRESEAYLAEAQRLSQTGSWAWNPATGDIRYWSEMCYCVLGFDPAGPLPRFEEFLHRIHPDDQAASRERFEKAIRDKADFELDYRVVHPEKGIRDIHVVGHAVLNGSSNLGEFVGTVIDVTERKSAEEALQQSQFYLTEGQRLAHMGSWAFNATGFSYWSSDLFRVYGLDPSGKPPTVEEYLALVHPEDRAFMKQGITQMLVDRRAFDFTKRIMRRDGEIRSVRWVGVPVTQGGTFQGFLGTGMDVTEQERLTKELRLSEHYLSEGQRLAHMGSWAFNPSGFFDYWSQELFKIYGLDPQKGAPTLEQYLATVHPQDRDFMAETIRRMHAERSGCDVKKRIVRPDGELRYIRCVGIPVVEGEILKGFLGTSMDITEQELLTQELELRQAHLTEAQRLTHTGSWIWHVPDRNALHLSEEWYRIYAFDPAEGPPAWEKRLERVHPEDRLKWKGAIERAIVETADYELEFRIVIPNGKVKWIHTVGHPVLSDTGDLEQFVGSSTDITERKCAEQERESLRSDLAHVTRVSMMGELVASISHELKQPIAAAIANANAALLWLKRDQPDLEEAFEAIESIVEDGKRAADIIDRLRSLYKKVPPKRELVEVNEIVDEMVILLRGQASRYAVSIHRDLCPDLPKIMADRVQLQQVLMNLMLNGIEAMKEMGGVLTVKSELDQDGRVLISVSDTGVGLPAEMADQIFSAFFTTKPQGSGMGLAISRSIIKSYGGHLWATANDGRGATFHFALPTAAEGREPTAGT